MITCCTRLFGKHLRIHKNVQHIFKADCSLVILNTKPFMGSIYFTNNFSSIELKKHTKGIKSHYYPHHVLAVVNTMQQFGFEEDEVKLLLANQPELMNIPSNLWNDIIETLYDYGFQKEDIFMVLEKNPQLLYLKKKALHENLQAWSNCGFAHHLLIEVITENPTFLQVNHTHVARRVKQYQLHFGSKNRAAKLLLLAPNTLEESWPILQDKLNYLDNLCTEKSDVVASGALAHSPFHIKARHEFLIRAGLYKRPQKDFHKRLSKNPTLSTIVNTTDKKFVSNSGLSMFEYEVFLEMFKEELDEEATYDSDNETSDDEKNN